MRTLIAALLTTVLAIPAAAANPSKPSLRDVAEIEDPLFAVAIAKEVSDICGSIAPRYIKGLMELRRLKSRANDLGYTDDEIRAYIESDAEKARMRAKGEALLAQNGVDYSKPETFCAYGAAEIEKNSAIGVLLKAK